MGNFGLSLFRSGANKANVFGRLWLTAERDGITQPMIEDVIASLRDSGTEEALAVAIELADYYFFKKEQPRYCDESLLFRLITAEGFFAEHRHQMLGYHWYVVANGFRARFPDRDMELFSMIVSHPECLMGLRSRNNPVAIADEIAQARQRDAWTIVSTALENDDSYYYVACWLGDELGFEEHPNAGTIRLFDPEIVMSWVMNDPATRARRVVRCLPKTLAETEGGLLTRLFLEKFGDDDALAGLLIGHFSTGGWKGPQSAHLSAKRDKAREWVSATKSGKTLSWLYRYIRYLSQRIEQAELEEEREF